MVATTDNPPARKGKGRDCPSMVWITLLNNQRPVKPEWWATLWKNEIVRLTSSFLFLFLHPGAFPWPFPSYCSSSFLFAISTLTPLPSLLDTVHSSSWFCSLIILSFFFHTQNFPVRLPINSSALSSFTKVNNSNQNREELVASIPLLQAVYKIVYTNGFGTKSSEQKIWNKILF